jgi:hypothetical protein
MHGPNNFLYRNFFIGSMAQIKIKIFQLQTFQRFIAAFGNMLPAQAGLIGFIFFTSSSKKNLTTNGI